MRKRLIRVIGHAKIMRDHYTRMINTGIPFITYTEYYPHADVKRMGSRRLLNLLPRYSDYATYGDFLIIRESDESLVRLIVDAEIKSVEDL